MKKKKKDDNLRVYSFSSLSPDSLLFPTCRYIYIRTAINFPHCVNQHITKLKVGTRTLGIYFRSTLFIGYVIIKVNYNEFTAISYFLLEYKHRYLFRHDIYIYDTIHFRRSVKIMIHIITYNEIA